MNGFLKKFLIMVIGIIVLAGVALILFYAVSMKSKDKDDSLSDVDEHTIFVDESADAEVETGQEDTEEQIYVSTGDTLSDLSGGNGLDSADDSGNIDAAIKTAESSQHESVQHERYEVGQDVEDKKAPVILINSKTAYVAKGGVFDIRSCIGYGDDVDRDVDLRMDGELDTTTTGVYPVGITLTDDAGHSTSTTINVHVVESSGESKGGGADIAGPPGSETFDDFREKYGAEATMLGIDVSRWQSNINFDNVKAAGCDFVIIRLGGYDDGSHYTDKLFAENIKNAKAAGLKVGIYWHAEEHTPEEARASVKYMLDVLGGEELDFPIAYDWEDFAHFQNYHMNFQDLNDCFEVFSDEVEAKGYESCLYSSLNFLNNGTWQNVRNHKVWLAHYTSKTTYTGDYYMWQHTSSGNINGIRTAVDFNVLY